MFTEESKSSQILTHVKFLLDSKQCPIIIIFNKLDRFFSRIKTKRNCFFKHFPDCTVSLNNQVAIIKYLIEKVIPFHLQFSNLTNKNELLSKGYSFGLLQVDGMNNEAQTEKKCSAIMTRKAK